MKPHISNSKNPLKDERYTPAETLAWCRLKAEVPGYDLDVAACVHSFKAHNWYGPGSHDHPDGLEADWYGHVWCNPPYSDIKPWVMKAWWVSDGHRTVESVSMLLPGNRTEQKWWQDLVEPYRDRPDSILRVHFLPGRVKFGAHPDDTSDMSTSAPFPCCLLVWRPK